MSAPREVGIVLGELLASREPTIVHTLLGSCIAVCLFDSERRVGGMNHFMLPAPENEAASRRDMRYGVAAISQLIERLNELGALRAKLIAKVFGGGHVLDTPQSDTTVPRRNIEFTRDYLSAQGIAIQAEDTGGRVARRVRFATHTGIAHVMRVEADAGTPRTVVEVRENGNSSWVSRGIDTCHPPKS